MTSRDTRRFDTLADGDHRTFTPVLGGCRSPQDSHLEICVSALDRFMVACTLPSSRAILNSGEPAIRNAAATRRKITSCRIQSTK
jgi:hypothetical protein